MEEISFQFADRATVPGWLGVDVQSEATETRSDHLEDESTMDIADGIMDKKEVTMISSI